MSEEKQVTSPDLVVMECNTIEKNTARIQNGKIYRYALQTRDKSVKVRVDSVDPLPLSPEKVVNLKVHVLQKTLSDLKDADDTARKIKENKSLKQK